MATPVVVMVSAAEMVVAGAKTKVAALAVVAVVADKLVVKEGSRWVLTTINLK
jgi:hypothetical protein